jgi:uncharacterized protein involved in exopolysaccharide biosynthesis
MNKDLLRNDTADLSSRLARIESMVVSDRQVFDFRALASALWRGKWLIAGTTFLFALSCTIVMLLTPNVYKAEAILVPATLQSPSAISASSGLGGLASLAGLPIGDESGNRAAIAMELVKTWGFLEKFARENGLQADLIAVSGWDSASGKLVYDRGLYDVSQNDWVPGKAPSGWDLYKALRKRVSIQQDKRTSLVTLSVEHYSPIVAKQWVDKLIVSINDHMRSQDQTAARTSIEYLQRQIEQTSLSRMHEIFYGLIEEQTKKLMLAEVGDEYVFKTLSPARVPEEKSGPRRLLNCILAALAGLLLSAFFWLSFVDVAPGVKSQAR